MEKTKMRVELNYKSQPSYACTLFATSPAEAFCIATKDAAAMGWKGKPSKKRIVPESRTDLG